MRPCGRKPTETSKTALTVNPTARSRMFDLSWSKRKSWLCRRAAMVTEACSNRSAPGITEARLGIDPTCKVAPFKFSRYQVQSKSRLPPSGRPSPPWLCPPASGPCCSSSLLEPNLVPVCSAGYNKPAQFCEAVSR